MLKLRDKRRAGGDVRAANRLAQIEASIVALQSEDLLDLADILRSQSQTPLAEMVSDEMKKRNIAL